MQSLIWLNTNEVEIKLIPADTCELTQCDRTRTAAAASKERLPLTHFGTHTTHALPINAPPSLSNTIEWMMEVDSSTRLSLSAQKCNF